MPEYDAATALVVVDVQNDFADPDGSLYVAGGEAVVPFINEQVAAADAARALVVYTQDWHPPKTPHFAKDGGVWPVHCVAESWGADFHPALDASHGRLIHKGVGGEDGYSGFTIRDPETGEEAPTELEAMLRALDIQRIVVVGLATDYCVKATALDGVEHGFETIVLADGIRAVNLAPGDGYRAVADMALAGVTIR